MTFPQTASIIADTLGMEAARIEPGTLLGDDLRLDCLDRMSLAAAVDEAFGIMLPDDDVTSWQTAGCIAQSVARMVG